MDENPKVSAIIVSRWRLIRGHGVWIRSLGIDQDNNLRRKPIRQPHVNGFNEPKILVNARRGPRESAMNWMSNAKEFYLVSKPV